MSDLPARALVGGPSRPVAWIVTGAGLVGFVLVAASLVPWDWVPGGRVVPVRPTDLLDPEQLRRLSADTL